VEILLKSEEEGELKRGQLEELVDSQKYKDNPKLREALLNKLKELGRVPQDKE
jgi:hypothetical protein